MCTYHCFLGTTRDRFDNLTTVFGINKPHIFGLKKNGFRSFPFIFTYLVNLSNVFHLSEKTVDNLLCRLYVFFLLIAHSLFQLPSIYMHTFLSKRIYPT